MVEGQFVPFDHAAEGVVVGHHADDVDRQGAVAPAVQQAVEAVTLLRHRDQHARAARAVVQRPAHVEARGARRERVTQGIERGHAAAVVVEGRAHEGPPRVGVDVVACLGDVGVVVGEEGRHRGDHARAVGAVEGQHVVGRGAHGPTLRGPRVRRNSGAAARRSGP